jgi:hypothetical protein
MRSDTGTFIRSASAAAIMLLVAGLLLRGEGYAAEQRTSAPTEYQVKAAFVNNFIKFVEWPLRGQGGNVPEDTVRLCVLGDLPDKATFEALDGQEVMGKRLSLVFLQEPEESRDCQVLFLPSTVSNRLPEVLEVLQGQPTLTIGDTEGYARRGVMINMYLENKRVRFEINAETSGAAGLRISAKLLNLAGMVYGVSRTGK